MAKKVKAIPRGYHTVTPSLVIHGAAEAIAFYRKAFAAKQIMRMPGPGGSIMHAEIRLGDSTIMLADEMPGMGSKSPATLGGSPVGFYVYVENLDATWKRAVAAGRKSSCRSRRCSGATVWVASKILLVTAGHSRRTSRI